MKSLLLTAALYAACSLQALSPGDDIAAQNMPLSIYLKSSAVLTGIDLQLGQIAYIEGDVSGSEPGYSLASEVIPPALYKDGIIDRGELRALLNGVTALNFRIIGTAVKIDTPTDLNISAEADEPAVRIQRGRRVKVVYAGQGVRVETSGVALSSGDLGSEVSVRVKAGRRIAGRVSGFDLVEVER